MTAVGFTKDQRGRICGVNAREGETGEEFAISARVFQINLPDESERRAVFFTLLYRRPALSLEGRPAGSLPLFAYNPHT